MKLRMRFGKKEDIFETPDTRAELGAFNAAQRDENITAGYEICDVTAPVIGGVCDNLTTGSTFRQIVMTIIAIPFLGFVLFVDIFGDWLTIVSQLFAEWFDGVPVAGTIFSMIEAPEFDDILDAISTVIVFYFCGPLPAVVGGLFEFPEGMLEIFPFWTLMIIIWLVLIRPARLRVLGRRREERADIERNIRITEAEGSNPFGKN